MAAEIRLAGDRAGVDAEHLFLGMAAVAVAAVAISGPDRVWGAAVAALAAAVCVAAGVRLAREERRSGFAPTWIATGIQEVLYLIFGASALAATLVAGVYGLGWSWWGSAAAAFLAYLVVVCAVAIVRAAHPGSGASDLVPTYLLAWGRTAPVPEWRRSWILAAAWETHVRHQRDPERPDGGRAAVVWHQDVRRLPWRVRWWNARNGDTVPAYVVSCFTFETTGYHEVQATSAHADRHDAHRAAIDFAGKRAHSIAVTQLPPAALDAYVDAVRSAS
ncbi:MAG: hypothetical protein JWQ20_1225 [Conexibacter sp.]|nr:hypothetical protein [Conexibacter sp.]